MPSFPWSLKSSPRYCAGRLNDRDWGAQTLDLFFKPACSPPPSGCRHSDARFLGQWPRDSGTDIPDSCRREGRFRLRLHSELGGATLLVRDWSELDTACSGNQKNAPGERRATLANVRGSRLCGGVKFEIIGPLMRMLNCNCSKCRKQHGAAFRSRARVGIEDFKWLQGEELVRFYQSSPGFYRRFCGACGSPIISKLSHPEFSVPLGILDDDPNVRPTLHCFVAGKALWFGITDTLPQFPELPDSYQKNRSR